ncbi:hypothetical protein LTS18_002758 [Coniosporium uncinatum]|uniref:Uncharacterized protein n=1 Tax=Coniosporium uncinatum TaxID=93489 RepID=A0ACC3DU74_9PEZI|nr:hypothetical protein LTS18_002758 [Coniosporium uncinatum]
MATQSAPPNQILLPPQSGDLILRTEPGRASSTGQSKKPPSTAPSVLSSSSHRHPPPQSGELALRAESSRKGTKASSSQGTSSIASPTQCGSSGHHASHGSGELTKQGRSAPSSSQEPKQRPPSIAASMQSQASSRRNQPSSLPVPTAQQLQLLPAPKPVSRRQYRCPVVYDENRSISVLLPGGTLYYLVNRSFEIVIESRREERISEAGNDQQKDDAILVLHEKVEAACNSGPLQVVVYDVASGEQAEVSRAEIRVIKDSEERLRVRTRKIEVFIERDLSKKAEPEA